MDRAVFEHCFDTDWYGYELLTNSNYRYLEDCHFKLYFACLCPCWNPPYFIRANGIYDEVIDKDLVLHEYGFEAAL